MEVAQKDLNEIQECLELLRSIESIEYHNKNWLPMWAIKNPGELSKEKLALIERMQKIVGTSATQSHT